MERCVVISAGEIEEKDIEKIKESDFVICADKGYDKALSFGVSPNLLIGDFDSIETENAISIETVKLPVEKDDTDTMAAIKEGLKRGYKSFVLIGAFGGLLDHQMANISSMLYIKNKDADALGHYGNQTAYVIKNEKLILEGKKGDRVSVFALEKETIVSLKGLKYELDSFLLSEEFPLGVSNELESEKSELYAENGALLVIHTKA